MATTTTPTMPKSSIGPAAITARALTEAPSSTTAISSSVLALKRMPRLKRSSGLSSVRTAVPIRIASTRLSSQARPNRWASARSRPTAARVTAMLRAVPGNRGRMRAGNRVDGMDGSA